MCRVVSAPSPPLSLQQQDQSLPAHTTPAPARPPLRGYAAGVLSRTCLPTGGILRLCVQLCSRETAVCGTQGGRLPPQPLLGLHHSGSAHLHSHLLKSEASYHGFRQCGKWPPFTFWRPRRTLHSWPWYCPRTFVRKWTLSAGEKCRSRGRRGEERDAGAEGMEIQGVEPIRAILEKSFPLCGPLILHPWKKGAVGDDQCCVWSRS